MKFSLTALQKYGKKAAKKSNHFKKFRPSKDQIIIDSAGFGEFASSRIHVAQSRKSFRKALVSSAPFVYDKKKGLLFYNENGSAKKLGQGGVVALFPRKLALTKASFKIINRSSSGSEPTPTSESTLASAVFPHGPRPIEPASETFWLLAWVGKSIVIRSPVQWERW